MITFYFLFANFYKSNVFTFSFFEEEKNQNKVFQKRINNIKIEKCS